MARKVFFSFHYDLDCTRAAMIRNMGVIEGNAAASDNDWETVKKGGNSAIEKWIDGQLSGRSCAIVLIGKDTAGRKWINYEIKKAWDEGKGLLGIHIHNLKNLAGEQASKGTDPFEDFTVGSDKTKLSSIVKVYDPPYTTSPSVYDHVKSNLAAWIEEAIQVRANR